MFFLAGITLHTIPAEQKTADPLVAKLSNKLETTIPVFSNTAKVGYCEVSAMVTFSIDEFALAESRLYDALMHDVANAGHEGEAACAGLSKHASDDFAVREVRYTPVN